MLTNEKVNVAFETDRLGTRIEETTQETKELITDIIQTLLRANREDAAITEANFAKKLEDIDNDHCAKLQLVVDAISSDHMEKLHAVVDKIEKTHQEKTAELTRKLEYAEGILFRAIKELR